MCVPHINGICCITQSQDLRDRRFLTINRAIVTSGAIAIAPKPASYDYFAAQETALPCPPLLHSQQSTVNRQQSND
ncbi:MAG: hypothetical protein WBA89_14065 [Microcoleus sp.]